MRTHGHHARHAISFFPTRNYCCCKKYIQLLFYAICISTATCWRYYQISNTASHYDICLFQAMCSTAFYAFLRVGEMTSTEHTRAQANLRLAQLVKLNNKATDVVSLKITFLNYKHNYKPRPFSININKQSDFCPVAILLQYLIIRGPSPGFLFVLNPVPRAHFATQLALALKFCNLKGILQQKFFSSHIKEQLKLCNNLSYT